MNTSRQELILKRSKGGLFMGRIIIFTGKGGVGKSSLSCAHAVKAAEEGRKTLIVSTDMAHNLSDIFEVQVKDEPVNVMKNLDALEIDPNHEMQINYGTISEAFKNALGSEKKENLDTLEDMVVFPGIEELFSLIKIKDIYDENIYDLIIVDCAPTGETLSLLKFPELFSWYMEKLFPIGKVALKVLRPVSKMAFKIELPNKKALNDFERLYVKLGELQNLLKDRDVCSIRIVSILEKMVLEECKRSYMYLNLYNFNVDGLYINRVIPKEADSSFFDEWKVIQNKYYEEYKSVFSEIPMFKIKWYESDINGIKGLKRICEDSLAYENIFDVLKKNYNDIFEKVEGGYKLTVNIPFADKEKFDLYRSNNELIIKIGNFKRNIPTPDVLNKYDVSKAKLREVRSSFFDKGVLTQILNLK